MPIIVVSDIGEQWSPHTAPAKQDEIDIISISLSIGSIGTIIGKSTPNVPQEVPVENESPKAIINITQGRNLLRLSALSANMPAT